MVGAPLCSSVLSRSTLRTASSSPISVRLWPSVRASVRATGAFRRGGSEAHRRCSVRRLLLREALEDQLGDQALAREGGVRHV